MRVAITGGTGFVGRHLAERLDDTDENSSKAIVVSRRTGVDVTDVAALSNAFTGCDAIVHCAGINRELGDQTYDRVHIAGTRAVIEAARSAKVKRIVMVSFLRARPDCNSGYHESKWAAEELIRGSGIDHTILKFGMIYGPGDHMINHVVKAVRALPAFATVGLRERLVRPVHIADAIDVLLAALAGRVSEPTVAVLGPEQMMFGEAVRRIARIAGRNPIFFPAPVWTIRLIAQLTEWTMNEPLVAKSQAKMLGEGVNEPAPFAPELPIELRPKRMFDDELIRAALPATGF